MKFYFFALLLFLSQLANAQSNASATTEIDLQTSSGTWIIDLRPSPDSQPYLKDFVITPEEGLNFSGVFYDTPFKNGYFNVSWDVIYFSFTTSDLNNSYFHSGYIRGNDIFGISYSPERQFTQPWTGVKLKQESEE